MDLTVRYLWHSWK